MKRKIMAVLLTLTMVVAGSSAAMAARGGKGDCGPQRGGDMGPGAFYTRMSKALKLTDEQKVQIKSIIKSERETAKPLMDKMRESRDQLRKAGETTSFDEAAVRNIAAGMVQTQTELAVSRARTHNKIYMLLTPEQRELAKSLKPDMKGRRQASPPPGWDE